MIYLFSLRARLFLFDKKTRSNARLMWLIHFVGEHFLSTIGLALPMLHSNLGILLATF